MDLGDKIQTLRRKRGWSQRELSRHSGVRQALISELELGKKDDTTGKILVKLALHLGVSVDYLAGMYDSERQAATAATRP